MKGKIVIKDKVYFEPEGLEKPNRGKGTPVDYHIALREYEASKQSLEVSNVIYYRDKTKAITFETKEEPVFVIGNEHCKAKITGKTATIIKIN